MSHFDYIIIGAGSAGCVIANRLSSNPKNSVLLIEAGSPDTKKEIKIPGAYGNLHRSEVDWAFWTEPQAHVGNRKLYIPRGKTLGGCSSTNAMAYVRGNVFDFDSWAALGNKGWSYEDVLPYFLKSEANQNFGPPFHSKNGELNVAFAKERTALAEAFIESCVSQNIPYNEDYNGHDQWGASYLQFTIKDGVRQSTAAAFLKPVLKRKNLTIRTSTQVCRILMENKTAKSVEAMDKSGHKYFFHANKEIILSAGAIQSPQILMLSGIGDEDELMDKEIRVVHHLPGVGKNLKDHLWTSVGAKTNIPTNNNVLKPMNMLKALAQYMFSKKGPLTRSPLEANAFIKTEEYLKVPDIQFHFSPTIAHSDYSTDIYDVKTFPKEGGFGVLVILLHPYSTGSVTLRSNNPTDPPVIQADFLSDNRDIDTLIRGVKKAIEVVSAHPLMKYCSNGLTIPAKYESDSDLKNHIIKSLETLYHPVGTCKMGNDEKAVVDAHLKVHGLKNLRVADASVMPEIISGNTNAAAIMIGEKAADMILAE